MTQHASRCFFLLQSALQPLWVLACSTIVEYSQQEGFYRVLLPAARQTPNLEDQWLERSNSRHLVSHTSETTRANPSSGRWNYGREIVENFVERGDFHVTSGLRIFSPEKSDGFGRVWTRELGYQGSARSPLDYRSRWKQASEHINTEGEVVSSEGTCTQYFALLYIHCVCIYA